MTTPADSSPDPGATPAAVATAASTDPVGDKLKALGLDDASIGRVKNELGATTEDDLSGITVDDLVGLGIKKLLARRIVVALTPAAPAHNAAAESAATSAFAASIDTVLPIVPADASWLEALRTGGILKVDQSTVIAAIRAALAHQAGLFSIPERLVIEMEAFADGNDDQVDPEYFKLRRQMTRRSYAEIFEAIDGLDGNYVTEARKKQLFARIDEHLWPAIREFNNQLRSWQEAWMQGAANPALMMTAILAGSGGVGVMPPGMMQPPDTGVLRDYADSVADASNKVFAGTGVQITAAVAFDALKIKQTLENPRLPALIGVANREQLLKRLKVAVSATYPRLEMNLTRFVLAILGVKDQPAGNEELVYFGAMFMLGSQLKDQLGEGPSRGNGRLTSIGGTRPSRDRDDL